MKTMMVWVAALALMGAGMASAGENPFSKVAVGDWARYSQSMGMMGMTAKGKLVLKVLEKSDTEVVLEQVMTMNIPGQGAQTQTNRMPIDLTADFDPTTMFTKDLPEGIKIEKGETGRETISLVDDEDVTFDSEFIVMKVSTEAIGDMPAMSGEIKTWTSKAFSMSMVKADMTMTLPFGEEKVQVTNTMQLAAFGDANTPDEDEDEEAEVEEEEEEEAAEEE